MAALPVRFEFHCGKAATKYIHNIPRSLVTIDTEAAQKDAEYVSLFVNVLQPIIKEHEAACLAISNPVCEHCGSPRMTALHTPMSWLHKVDDPFVVVWVNPICEKGECETRVRQQVQQRMAEAVAEGQAGRAPGPSDSVEIIPCRVCGKTEGTMRCARCRVVAYCGREHQRLDWKDHKKKCVPKDGESR